MNNKSNISPLANDNLLVKTVQSVPENFDKSKEQLDAAIDNQKMMEAIAKYRGAHTVMVKEYHINRNDMCPCGSGKKYKKCCLESGKYEQLVAKK